VIKNFLTFVKKNLSKKNKFRVFLYIIFDFFQSVLDLFAFSIIIPIILFVINREFISIDNKYLNFLYLQVSPYFGDITKLLSIIFIIFLLKYIFSIFINIFQIKFTYNLTASVRSLLLSKYLSSDYGEIFKKKSSVITNEILFNAERAIEVFFINSLNLIKSTIHVLIFVIFLLFVNFFMTLIIGLFTISFLVIYYFLIKNKILIFGKKKFEYSSIFVKHIQEIYNGFHIIKLFNLEKKVYKLFREKVLNYSNILSIYKILITLPKVSKEIFLLVILIISYFTLNFLNYSDAYIANYIAVFGVVGLRLFPALIFIFSTIGNIKNSQYSMEILNKELNKFYENNSKKYLEITINEKIEFKNISFNYTDKKEIFKNLNFKLEKGQIIGIRGKNGIGKSTLLKIISGLLKPNNGEIYLDDKKLINLENYNWNNSISYIEQDGFLFSDTILHNITLTDKNITKLDNSNIEHITKGINLSNFINSTKDGLSTIISENTTNLSGGEKQKIAISRALFKKSNFLLLDESLSNIDESSTIKIMQYFKTLKQKGFIIITHNKKILNVCDKIFDLENNKFEE